LKSQIHFCTVSGSTAVDMFRQYVGITVDHILTLWYRYNNYLTEWAFWDFRLSEQCCWR